ncbi:peptidyl-prolyl cis-trans isomerase cwc27-like protein [Moniliophthora roreri MCA 2997]|uniref:Peptidyl-prolyl isomerase CWC27 n=1 Tax=Moniliophthora roreri (strain MCA 2997) TaxID=1381753 RepID=V2XHL1_MONRO|nr:peptidyl-prolyl cis-trans isomerase cwc27-like protein [Moniliophthora roreri MCA 2997]
MALPTNGRVMVDTTVGEIDIELWSKETPKTCRNFLQLAMEGYYDGVIFHRVVPGFLVQTGDKTGTGAGGESIYGEPFEDEIHPRLRFAHRGLVAMANNGTKNSNDSQFIITLDRADELHGKHTLFGRVIGDTVYNVMKIGEMELDKNERPVYPPKIKTIRILDNPFPDIVPRITAAEKRAQQRAREEAQKEREEEMRRRGAKKNVKLLSFGADEGEGGGDEEEEPVTFKKKAIFRPDLVDNNSSSNEDPVLPDFVTKMPQNMVKEKDVAPSKSSEDTGKKSKKEKDLDITRIREQHAAEKTSSLTARQTEIEKMEADIRKLARKRAGDDSDDENAKKKQKKSYLEEELNKYAKGRGLSRKMRRKDEGDVLAKLAMFKGRLQQTEASDGEGEGEEGTEAQADGDAPVVTADDPGIEVDDDRGFLSHKLYFPKDDGEESRKAERDYEVIDPRQRGARAREEEKERKRKERARGGGGRPRHGGGGHGERRR